MKNYLEIFIFQLYIQFIEIAKISFHYNLHLFPIHFFLHFISSWFCIFWTIPFTYFLIILRFYFIVLFTDPIILTKKDRKKTKKNAKETKI